MTFRVTHIDIAGHRHQFRVTTVTTALAMAWAEQLYGDARKLSVIRLGRALP